MYEPGNRVSDAVFLCDEISPAKDDYIMLFQYFFHLYEKQECLSALCRTCLSDTRAYYVILSKIK